MQKSPVIVLENVRKSYGSTLVLEDISFSVEPGQVVGYLGPNGAGKSTTLKILLGILPEFEGNATVFGLDVRKAGPEVRRRIGYVPEVSDLYDVLSGDEYLGFLARLHGLSASTAQARSQGLADVLELGGALGARIATYSKGMRQKLMIIASLLHDPDLLFWDEPLSGLDANMALVIKQFMAQLAQAGKTLFYSSHVMEVVEQVSDRIIILNTGRIVADGNIAQLRAESSALNLESLFSSLTGPQDQADRARQLVGAMSLTGEVR